VTKSGCVHRDGLVQNTHQQMGSFKCHGELCYYLMVTFGVTDNKICVFVPHLKV